MTDNHDTLDEHLLKNKFEYQDDLYVQDRLISMFADYMIFCFISIPIVIALEFIFKQVDSLYEFEIFIVVLYPIYFCKDIVFGKSLAKRIRGQIVIDYYSKLPANPIKSVIRNLTVPLFPIEILVVIFSPKRRIGDFISNTKVVRIPKESPLDIRKEIKRMDSAEVLLAILIAIIGAFGVIYVIDIMANAIFF